MRKNALLGLLIVIACLCLTQDLWAQGGLNIIRDSKGKVIALKSQSIMAKTEGSRVTPRKAVRNYIPRLKRLLGASKRFEVTIKKKSPDKLLRMEHVKAFQSINGVPVIGGEANFHLKDSRIVSAELKLAGDLNIDTTPVVTREQAEQIALSEWREDNNTAETPDFTGTSLSILALGLVRNNSNDKSAFLVWGVGISSAQPLTDEIRYVDASKGGQIETVPRIKHINRRVLDCSKYPGSPGCYIDSPALYYDYWHGRSEAAPVRGPDPRVEYQLYYGSQDNDYLHELFGVTHTYWLNTFGRNGANNQGGLSKSPVTETKGYTHVDNPYPTVCPAYAWYSTSTSTLAFCRRMVTPDLVGHEYAHGVDMFTFTDVGGQPIGSIGTGENGALEEAFCDLHGEAVEQLSMGTHDWRFGIWGDTAPGTYPSSLHGIYRDLSQPWSLQNTDGYTTQMYPARFYSSDIYCGASDSGGIHHNSAVPSYAFYLMSEGGDFNGCTIAPIGFEAARQILYRAWTVYFVRTETFNEAYYAFLNACNDLYGSTNPEYCTEVEKALQAVEMDQQGICLDPLGEHYHTPACAQAPLPGAVDPARPDLETTLLFAPDENVFSLGQEWTGVGTVRAVLCDAGAKRLDGSQIVPFNGIFADITVNPDGTFAAPLWSGAAEGQFEIVIDRNGDWIYDPIEDRTVTFDVRRPVDGDGVCYQGENLITSEDCHDAPTDCACSVGYSCARMTPDVNGPYECRRKVKPTRYNVMMLPEPER